MDIRTKLFDLQQRVKLQQHSLELAEKRNKRLIYFLSLFGCWFGLTGPFVEPLLHKRKNEFNRLAAEALALDFEHRTLRAEWDNIKTEALIDAGTNRKIIC